MTQLPFQIQPSPALVSGVCSIPCRFGRQSSGYTCEEVFRLASLRLGPAHHHPCSQHRLHRSMDQRLDVGREPSILLLWLQMQSDQLLPLL